MASEQVPGSEMQEDSKPSFFNKVKAKAKMLKSKIKHHGSTEDSPEASPTSGDPHTLASAPGPTDHDVDQSDTSESDGEGKNYEIPYTPLNSALPHPTRPPGATVPSSEGSPVEPVASGQSAYGTDTMKTDEKSFAEDPSVLKSEGPVGTEQAVPTNYSYFNADPEQATRPSNDDVSQSKQEEVPSSLGGESAGLTPAVGEFSQSKQEEVPSSLGREFASGNENPFADRDDKLSKSGDREAELLPSSVASQDSEQQSDVGLVEPSEPSEESLLSHSVEQDRGLSAREPSSESGNASTETDQDQHQGYGRLAAAAAGAAGAGGVAAGIHHEFDSSQDQAPGEEGALNEDNSSKLATGDSEEPGFQPAADNLNETGAEALPTSETGADESTQDKSFLSSQEQDLGQDNSGLAAEEDQQKPMTSNDLDLPSSEREQEPLVNSETESASRSENTGFGDQAMSDSTPVSQEASDSAIEGKDHAADALGSTEPSTEQAPSFDEEPVSEKVSEAATSQATAATEQDTNSDQQPKTLTGSFANSLGGLPSIFTSKLGLGGGSPASTPTSAPSDSTDLPSETSPTSDTPTATSPTSDTPTETSPTSDTLTETSPTSDTPTATSDASHDSSTTKDTPHPNPPAAAPGLFDRVSALFGGGAKQPAAQAEKPAGET